MLVCLCVVVGARTWCVGMLLGVWDDHVFSGAQLGSWMTVYDTVVCGFVCVVWWCPFLCCLVTAVRACVCVCCGGLSGVV